MDNPSTFTDSRGTITDLLVTPDYSITHITFTEGAVRGNHFHKETTQMDIVLKGELIAVRQANGRKANYTLFEGDKTKHLPNESHVYKATKPSEIISICWGVRKGADYEKDTYKLEENLI